MESLPQEALDFIKWLKEEQEQKIDYTPIEYIPSENEVILAETLNPNLPQLAPFVDFLISARLGRVSTLLVAPRQGGKSKSILISTQIIPAERIDGLDPSTLAKKLRQPRQNVNNKMPRVDCYVEDMTNLINLQTLPIIATLIFQHKYETAQLEIPDIDLCFIGGCHHERLAQLIALPEWTQMLQDRLIRLYLLYWNRPKPQRVLRDDEFPEISEIKIDFNLNPEFEITNNQIESLIPILEAQISPERAFNFIKSILKGHAIFCGRDEVTEEDLNWFSLFEPVLSIEQYLYRRTPKSEKLSFNELAFGILHEYLKDFSQPDRIARRFRITPEALKSYLQKLGEDLNCKFEIGKEPSGLWIEKLKNLHNIFTLEPL